MAPTSRGGWSCWSYDLSLAFDPGILPLALQKAEDEAEAARANAQKFNDVILVLESQKRRILKDVRSSLAQFEKMTWREKRVKKDKPAGADGGEGGGENPESGDGAGENGAEPGSQEEQEPPTKTQQEGGGHEESTAQGNGTEERWNREQRKQAYARAVSGRSVTPFLSACMGKEAGLVLLEGGLGELGGREVAFMPP